MIVSTTELRWFFRGTVAAEMGRWIRHGDLWAQQPERTDVYLHLPGCRSAGVKLREGRFEVKVRTEPPAGIAYPGGVRGYREAWLKWSRDAGDVAPDEDFWRAEGERWIPVRKRRVLRGFSLDDVAADEAPREVPLDGEHPRRGCGVEIAGLVVGSGVAEERWWTLGLEGYDAAGDPSGALERVGAALFEQEPPPIRLELEDSQSYAAWLATR